MIAVSVVMVVEAMLVEVDVAAIVVLDVVV